MQNTQTAGAPATPDLSASVNASQLANPVPSIPSGEMLEGGDIAPETTNNSNHNFAQWLAIVFIGLSTASIIMQIILTRRSLQKLNQDDTIQKERLAKAETRLDILEKTQPVRRAA